MRTRVDLRSLRRRPDRWSRREQATAARDDHHHDDEHDDHEHDDALVERASHR